ncbi:MAG: hypothetical protein OES24_17790 [Acidimicrobiia bacterium]|nr:hypothetical protein [Acidimicrobiia bacterium]
MTEPDSAREDLVAGLNLDHLNPPDIVAFFAGLPRRVAVVLVRDDPHGDEEAKDGVVAGDDRGDDEGEPLPVEEMNAIADTLQRLIDSTKSVGFSLEPHVAAKGIDPSTRQALPPDVQPAMDRIEAGATEVARRLAGLSSAAWKANADLLAEARYAVADAVGPLRVIERHRAGDD